MIGSSILHGRSFPLSAPFSDQWLDRSHWLEGARGCSSGRSCPHLTRRHRDPSYHGETEGGIGPSTPGASSCAALEWQMAVMLRLQYRKIVIHPVGATNDLVGMKPEDRPNDCAQWNASLDVARSGRFRPQPNTRVSGLTRSNGNDFKRLLSLRETNNNCSGESNNKKQKLAHL